jgi:hypothetical protein
MSDPFNVRRPAEPPPEWPRSEPEIIPPGRRGGSGGGFQRGAFEFIDREGRRRRYTIGPFTVILALVTVAVLAGLVLLLVFGALLIWIPVAAIAVAALLTTALARGYWLRFRRWLGR